MSIRSTQQVLMADLILPKHRRSRASPMVVLVEGLMNLGK
jgi:hypothetical protein